MSIMLTFASQFAMSFVAVLAFKALNDYLAKVFSHQPAELMVQIKATLAVDYLILAGLCALTLAGLVVYFGTPIWRVLAYSAIAAGFVLRRR